MPKFLFQFINIYSLALFSLLKFIQIQSTWKWNVDVYDIKVCIA